MMVRSSVVVLAAASPVGTPAARAEQRDETSLQEEYDRHFIGFENFVAVDPKTGAVRRATEVYEGRYRKPIEGADFYRKVGREDLAQEYALRAGRQSTLRIAGGVIALSAFVASAIIVANSMSADPCDVNSPFPDFARCASERASQARSGVTTAAIVGISGGLVGGALLIAAAVTDPNPVDASQMRELADQYNRQLKQKLGVSVVPLASPDRAGFALDLRF